MAYRDHAEIVRIADRSVTDREFSGRRLHQRIGAHDPKVKRLGNRKGLHRGAGLKRVGQYAVADIFHAHKTPSIGVVRRPIAHRKNFTGSHIHDNHGAGFGLMALNRVLKRFVGNELQSRINREHHIGADFTLFDPDVFDNTAQAVANDTTGTLLAGKNFVVGKLHPFSAVVV